MAGLYSFACVCFGVVVRAHIYVHLWIFHESFDASYYILWDHKSTYNDSYSCAGCCNRPNHPIDFHIKWYVLCATRVRGLPTRAHKHTHITCHAVESSVGARGGGIGWLWRLYVRASVTHSKLISSHCRLTPRAHTVSVRMRFSIVARWRCGEMRMGECVLCIEHRMCQRYESKTWFTQLEK